MMSVALYEPLYLVLHRFAKLFHRLPSGVLLCILPPFDKELYAAMSSSLSWGDAAHIQQPVHHEVVRGQLLCSSEPPEAVDVHDGVSAIGP